MNAFNSDDKSLSDTQNILAELMNISPQAFRKQHEPQSSHSFDANVFDLGKLQYSPNNTTSDTATLQTLMCFSREVLTHTDNDTVERALSQAILQAAKADYVHFLRYDTRRQILHLTHISGSSAHLPLEPFFPHGQGLAWQAVEKQKILCTTGMSLLPAQNTITKSNVPVGVSEYDITHLDAADFGVTDFGVTNFELPQTTMYIPIICGSQLLHGVLQIGRTEQPFSDTETSILEAFANTGAMALGRLHELDKAAQVGEGAMLALGVALEARDIETQGHTERTVKLAEYLAQSLSLPSQIRDALRHGAYMHDVGKLSVPDDILLKPSSLTDRERREMQKHVVLGESLTQHIPTMRPQAFGVVRSHHERWNGGGYPDGLAGEDIPLLARIFAIVDVFDAMTHHRPYHEAAEIDEVLHEIEQQAGEHFDPHITDAFLDLAKQDPELVKF